MPKDVVVPKLKLRHKGIFNLGDLLKNIKDWLVYNGYGDEEKSFQEASYTERIKGETKQIESKWIAQKEVNDYFANVIEITFVIIGLADAEIDAQGRKIKTNTGEVEITIKADLIKDKKESWGPFMRQLYENIVIKDRIGAYKTALYGKAYELHD